MRSLAHVVPSALVYLLRRVPTSQGKVEFAWSAAVGHALQRVTQVRLEGNVLVVEAASAQWVREITRSSAMILQRLQSYLGESTVAGIDVRTNTNLHVKS
jgi:predicted nucleic acid-binding Zn ribbon protein